MKTEWELFSHSRPSRSRQRRAIEEGLFQGRTLQDSTLGSRLTDEAVPSRNVSGGFEFTNSSAFSDFSDSAFIDTMAVSVNHRGH